MKKIEKTQLLANLVSIAKDFDLVDDLRSELDKIILSDSQNTSTDNSEKIVSKAEVNTSIKPVKSKEIKESKETKAHDYGLPVFTQDKKLVRWTNGDGTPCRHKGIKTVINARIKALGGTWNYEALAWEFKTQKAAKACVETIDRVVTEDQFLSAWNDVNSKRQAHKNSK